MQIQFDPNSIDLTEAAVPLGVAIPAFVKSCVEQGETLAEVQAALAAQLEQVWTVIADAKEPKGR